MIIDCGTQSGVVWCAVTDWQVGQRVAVFRIRISQCLKYGAALRAVLQPAEISRAAAYHRPADQSRFAITRAALRLVIGKYTGAQPAEINFRLGKRHKPEVAGNAHVRFNVSHAGDWALLALSGNEVGVDVEEIVPDFNFQPVVNQVFAPDEQQRLAGCSGSAEAFFRAWTRKEAFAKATGQGLDEHFWTIPAADGRHFRPPAENQPAQWVITSFVVQAGYVGALAYPVAANAPEVDFFEFDASLLVR